MTEPEVRDHTSAVLLTRRYFPFQGREVDNHAIRVREGEGVELNLIGEIQDQAGQADVLACPDCSHRRFCGGVGHGATVHDHGNKNRDDGSTQHLVKS